MNTQTSRYLALFLLAMPSVAFANNKWFVECKETCKTCGNDSSCVPGTTTYTVGQDYDNDKKDDAQRAADNENLANPGAGCVVRARQLTTGSKGQQATEQLPGITSLNYKREGIVFEGAGPDDVKYETVGGIRKPRQLITPRTTVDYRDSTDGKGYQVAQYLTDQLPAPGADGIRSIPADAQPISVTIYRNPVGDANTTGDKLDVVHRQRHPQSGTWVTTTIRLTSPQSSNTWKREWFQGDPLQTTNLEPYRAIEVSRTPHPDGTETVREITTDLTTDGEPVMTKDQTLKYGFYKYANPVVLEETNHTGTGSELTSIWTYYTNHSDQASFNKPKTLRRNDGQWANYTYTGSLVTGVLVTKTVSCWLDNTAPAVGAAPNEAANRVVVVIEAQNETGTFSREEKIQGTLVSKTWGERFKDNSGFLIEKSHVETGATTLTTIRTGYPNNESVAAADRGRLKSIQNPDGSVELHFYALQGENRVVTIDKGAGTLSSVIDGIRTISTYTNDETLIKEVVSDIATNVELSAKEVIAFDANGKPTRWAYNHDNEDYSETTFGCCGIDSERSRDGITTTYTRDTLKRPLTAVSQGITLTYTYGKKAIGGTEFPTENVTATAGGLTLDQGTTVHDFARNVIQKITPDLDGDGNQEITALSRNFSTRTNTTTNPDGGTAISIRFADGQNKSTTGTATEPAYFDYTTHNEQGGGFVTIKGSTATGPWNKTYANLAGSTLKSTFYHDSTESVLQTNTFDSLGRIVSTKNADSVTQLVAYNVKGEAYRRAIDLNQNGQIDNADRVTDTIEDVIGNSPIGNALRTRSIIYDLDNNPVTVTIKYRTPDGVTTRQETLGVANPSISTSAGHSDRSDGSWVDSFTAPDGTKEVTTYANWLEVSTCSLSAENSPLETISMGYDALRRPITRTHSRTGLVTTHFDANGQVEHVDDHGSITSFGYDSMGRRISTTLPDNSITHTSYWPSGQEKATWGSHANPTVKLYTAQGKLHKLRTFRSAELALNPDENTDGYDETTWTYNDSGYLTTKTYADGRGIDYTYTAAGQLLSRTWARTLNNAPLVTIYGYNLAGKLVTTDYSDSTPDVTIAYDKLGRQQSVTNGRATTVFTYDLVTLALDSETITYDINNDGAADFTRVLDHDHDNLGRPTGFQLKNGTTIENQANYGYSSSDGRLATVEEVGVPLPQSFTYGYLANSSLVETITATAGGVHTVTNTWEPTRNALTSKQNKIGTNIVSQYDYTVNAIGQRTAVVTSGTAFPAASSWVWSYDSLGQVISADSSINTSDRAYEYDTIGNRKKAASSLTLPSSDNYTSNELNQYSVVNSVSPSYDDDGNATAYPLPASPTANCTLVWDAENRLVSTTVGTTTKATLYDFQSRRIAETIGSVTTFFVYDGWNCIAEYTGNTLTKTNLWGLDLSGSLQGAGGVGGLLLITEHSTASNYAYPTYDGNGNVSEYLAADGAISAHFEYDFFGNTIINTDAGNLFAYRFSTKPLDFSTGLYYYGYRYYDPLTGRWPSRDSVEESGGLNMYCFTDNNPVQRIDKLGMSGLPATPDLNFDYKGGYKATCPIDTKDGNSWELMERGVEVPDVIKGPETISDSTEGDVFGAKAWRIMKRKDVSYIVTNAGSEIGSLSCGQSGGFSTYVEKSDAHSFSLGASGGNDSFQINGNYTYSWGSTSGYAVSAGPYTGSSNPNGKYEYIGLPVELIARLHDVHASFSARYLGEPWVLHAASSYQRDSMKIRPGIMVCRRKCKCVDP